MKVIFASAGRGGSGRAYNKKRFDLQSLQRQWVGTEQCSAPKASAVS